jgi:hypothetical protein
VDGNWTISRALRQESDDIMEIGGEQLRPYVELIAGAEPAHADESDDADRAAGRPLANGHSAVSGVGSYQQLPTGSGNHAPPSIYTAPVVAEYQRPALQLPRTAERPAREDRSRDDRSRDDRTREDRSRDDRSRDERVHQDRVVPSANGEAQAAARQDLYAAPSPPVPSPPARGRQDRTDRPDRPERQERQERLEPQNRPEPAAPAPGLRPRAAEDASGYPQGQPGVPGAAEPVPGIPSLTGLTGVPGLPGSPGIEGTQTPGQLRRLPSRPSGPGPAVAPMPSGPHAAQGQGSARSAPYSGPQPVVTSAPPLGPGYQSAGAGPSGASLGDAVQAAHEEGQEFGASVARDAPALWLEAVLARKPRMPSDLEARLLQGSALPIDFLLHDEVRHALRRGFWDALERTRR